MEDPQLLADRLFADRKAMKPSDVAKAVLQLKRVWRYKQVVREIGRRAGISEAHLSRLMRVWRAAEGNPQAHADLLIILDAQSVNAAWEQLIQRGKHQEPRHAVLRKQHYRNPSKEIGRALVQLEAIAFAFDRYDAEFNMIEADLRPGYIEQLKEVIHSLNKFGRRLQHEQTKRARPKLDHRDGAGEQADGRSKSPATL
jgi:hypothetical protein